MPNMCPALVFKNKFLSETFMNNDDIDFFLISFDYIYDTPSLMNLNYSNTSNMKFLSSYGRLNDIFTLASQANVSFWGVDENDIGHTLRTVLIDPERRLMKAFEGLDWKAEKAEKDIKNILKIYNN